jgi:hypothetical protein
LFPLQILFYLAVGWALYLVRVVPEITVNWSGVATSAGSLALLAVGLHLFLRWLYAADRTSAAGPVQGWRPRWTAALLGVIVLMFVAGISAVGVTHQTAWLATSPEPTFEVSPVDRILVSNQLHELSHAMLKYAEAHKLTLPPHARCGPEGEPLLSWRVLLLPYFDEEKLFKEFHLDEPWDSPHNLRLLPRMPRVYAPVSKRGNPKEHATYFQVFVGHRAAFEGRDGVPCPGGFSDGPGNTILIVEAAQAVPWTKPADLAYFPDAPLPPLGAVSPTFFVAAMADGSVRNHLKKGLSDATLRAAITRNGGETLGPDW